MNLRVGAPAATDAQLWSALTRVALAERVRDLGGLDAPVGEDGGNLSAGERARLALARVIVADRPWVLLDEPTAHLDPVTCRVLLDVLVEISATAGVVLVAHDPSVVAVADRVVELEVLEDRGAPATPVTVSPRTIGVPTRPPHVEIGSGASERPARFVLSTVLGILASLCGVALTATAGWLIVKASAHPPTLTLLVAIVGVRTFGLGRPVLRYAERLRSHDEVLRLLADRRVQVYDTVVPLTPGRLGKRRGDVLSSIVDDVDAVVDRELRIRLPLRTAAAVVSVAAVVCGWILPAAGLLLAVTSTTGGVLAYALARRASRGPVGDTARARAELSTVMAEALTVAPDLRMWQAGCLVTDRVRSLAAVLGTASVRTAAAVTWARSVVQLAVLAGVCGTAAIVVDAGTVPAPAAALLLLVPVALTDVLLGVADAGLLSRFVEAAEDRLLVLEGLEPAVHEPSGERLVPSGSDLVVREAALGWGDTPVLEGISLRVRPGARVGVVGPSGSGKSTLAACLLRFIDPVSGDVHLGGRRLTSVRLADVRGTVGYVDDDPHIFATTLVENVRLAKPDATDQEVVDALVRAHLSSWVASLPEGIWTWLGEGSAAVSGGERARIGVARSLLLDQPVLVLDEPVAHLDTATAVALAADVLGEDDGRAIVWITHSPVGLDRTDEVVDLGGCATARDLTRWSHG